MNINILGIRGIPAAHGGFETFVAKLAPFLRDRGHSVTVYCQEDEGEQGPWEDMWEGIRRVHFRPKRTGPIGTMEFDLACVKHVVTQPGVDLVLGYNTAVFNVLQRLKGRKVIMNMDGVEWKRAKWSLPAKIWFFVNELLGANFCNIAIADHPEIAKHIGYRSLKRPIMIPYGSDKITSGEEGIILRMGLTPDEYFISIARIEPENSILELVSGFSTIDTNFKFVVLGKLEDGNEYHEAVKAAAGENVIFPGAIYNAKTLSSLRFHTRAYCHGHQVGGTNPSLVEALGAGNAVIAHQNRFNKWVAGDDHLYFNDEQGVVKCMKDAIANKTGIEKARNAAAERHKNAFQWNMVLHEYENLFIASE